MPITAQTSSAAPATAMTTAVTPLLSLASATGSAATPAGGVV